MPLDIKQIFFKADSTPLPVDKKAETQVVAWKHNHELRYILPQIERALGRCEIENVFSLINEAKSYHPNSQELDRLELRAQLYKTDVQARLQKGADYVARYPTDIAGWMVYIKLTLISDKDATFDQQIDEAFADDPTTAEALKLHTKKVFESKDEKSIKRLLLKAPNHPLCNYLYLTLPCSIGLDSQLWNRAFQSFLNSSTYNLNIETASDILVAGMERGKYREVITWIDKQELTKDHLSINLLKAIAHLILRESEAFHEVLPVIRHKSEQTEISSPLFVGADRARATVIATLSRLSNYPHSDLLAFGELLSYVCESEMALSLLKQVVKTYKDDPMILARMGYLESLENTENPRLAIKGYFDLAFAACEKNTLTWAKVNTLYGRALFQLRAHDEAIAYFEKGVEDEAFVERIKAYLKVKKQDKAAQVLVNAEKNRYVFSWNDWVTFGTLYQQGDNYTKALECLEKAEALKPDHFLVLSVKAAIYHCLDRYKEAATYAKRALKLQPDNVNLLGVLGSSSVQINDFPAAFEAYKRPIVLGIVTSNRVYTIIKLGKALKRIQELVTVIGKVNPAVLELDAILEGLDVIAETGDVELYHKWVDAGIKKFPGESQLLIFRGSLRAAEGNIIGALQDFKAAGKEKEVAMCQKMLEIPLPIDYYRNERYKNGSAVNRPFLQRAFIWDYLAQVRDTELAKALLENPAHYTFDSLIQALKSGTSPVRTENCDYAALYREEEKQFIAAYKENNIQVAMVAFYAMIKCRLQIKVPCEGAMRELANKVHSPADINFLALDKYAS